MDGKISDKIHSWCAFNEDTIIDNDDCDELLALADRIDAEMVELPRDKDGEPIHLGDTVYDLNLNEQTVLSLHLYEKALTIDRTSPMWTVSFGFGTHIAPRDLTHERHDSFERIADELEAWCNSSDGDDACDTPRVLAERIRKLAKEG